MANYKIYDFRINGTIASGIIKGLYYRVKFDYTPSEKEAKSELRKTASYNN